MNKTQNFIERATKIHGDKYDYSKVKYKLALEKVIIVCNIHGEFEQNPNTHLQGKGCKKCGTTRAVSILTFNTDSFIEKSKETHGDKYNYSKVQYTQIYDEVTIICKKHGDFLQVARNHINGSGCKLCGYEIIGNKLRGDTKSFIKKAINIHGDKYDYSKVNYVNIDTTVIIICKIHGEFNQSPDCHLGGNGCKKCANNTQYTTSEWILLAEKKHGNRYDYSKVQYVNARSKVIIICNEHGEFNQIPGSHILGCECPKCASNWQYSTSEWIVKAEIIHENKYDYSEVNYSNNKNKVIIICKTHGKFKQNPGSHLQGSQCPKCEGGVGHTNVEFIENAIKKHGDIYDYSKVDYINQSTHIIIICKKHGEFKQSPSNHLSGKGCYHCSLAGYSKKSIKCLDYIAKHDGIHIMHAVNGGEFKIPNTKFKADGYCQKINTIFEFHGCFYHGCRECFDENDTNPVSHKTFKLLYDNTMARELVIKNNGYRLITIWEHEWDRIVTNKKNTREYFDSEKQNLIP